MNGYLMDGVFVILGLILFSIVAIADACYNLNSILAGLLQQLTDWITYLLVTILFIAGLAMVLTFSGLVRISY